MNVDLARNPKQEMFFKDVLSGVYGLSDYRNFFYGGAIRGGKTFVSLATLLFLCKQFPNSRWHIIRADFPALLGTTIPSLDKMISGSPGWGWSRDRANYFAYHKKTDSKIFFKGENIKIDPELNDFLGLETNGLFFEQIEELSKKMWQVGISRNGSWYIDKMPKPITMSTFNPTQRWIKDFVYVPWKKGELKPPYYFLEALPQDNAFVTQEQYAAWSMMDERYQKQFIGGDWTNFDGMDNRWAYSYSSQKHGGRPEPNIAHPLFISCDFNRNPMCWSIIQHYEGKIRVLRTLKIPNSGSDALCDMIKVLYPGYLYIVTGDYSGNTATTLFAEQISNYSIIKSKLGLSASQVQITPNPSLEKNRTLVNSVLQNYPVEIHDELATGLHFDLGNVKALADGTIEKTDRKDPAQQADALDTFRYFCNKEMSWIVKV